MANDIRAAIAAAKQKLGQSPEEAPMPPGRGMPPMAPGAGLPAVLFSKKPFGGAPPPAKLDRNPGRGIPGRRPK